MSANQIRNPMPTTSAEMADSIRRMASELAIEGEPSLFGDPLTRADAALSMRRLSELAAAYAKQLQDV